MLFSHVSLLRFTVFNLVFLNKTNRRKSQEIKKFVEGVLIVKKQVLVEN